MATVTRRRPARSSRVKTDRRQASKPVRKTAVKKSPPRERASRRAKPREDALTRIRNWIADKLAFHRPMLYLSGGLLALAFVAALFAGGYVRAGLDRLDAAATAVSNYAGFGISKLHLAGENRTSPEKILAVLNFTPGQSIFDADLRGARQRLLQLPWVKKAEIARRYPDSISVTIVERHPFALWDSPKGLKVIERSGRVITGATRKEFPHLPVFAGDPPKDGAQLVEAIAANRAVAARVRIMQRVGHRRWNLILDDGVVVKLPGTGWRKQIGVLEHLIVDKGILERAIRGIDLRSKDNYFFELRQPNKAQRGTQEHAA